MAGITIRCKLAPNEQHERMILLGGFLNSLAVRTIGFAGIIRLPKRTILAKTSLNNELKFMQTGNRLGMFLVLDFAAINDLIISTLL